MTLPTVIEITPQLQAVTTPETFIDTLAAETRARFIRATWLTAADHERASSAATPFPRAA